MHPTDVLATFRERRALVVGDAILDGFLIGDATRLCRERPVPVLVKREQRDVAGGAANTSVNIRALGAAVRFVSLLGDDENGRRLRDVLATRAIGDDDLVVVPDARTSFKLRVLAGDHYISRIDEEPAGFDDGALATRVVERVREAYAQSDVVVVSDYGVGTVSAPVMRALATLRRRRRIPLVIDAQRIARFARVDADVITPNLQEAADAAGLPIPDPEDERAVRRIGDVLLARFRAAAFAITLGEHGVFLARRGRGKKLRLDGRRVAVRNVSGAGDSFAASLALGLASGAGLDDAARLALEAAAVAVAKAGTAVVAYDELRERLELLGESDGTARLRELRAVAGVVEKRRLRGERIVLTNGVFDILHEGHVRLLQRARALGDALVVAINSDRSARRLKGEDRPINPQEHRRAVLEALSCVDHVVIFDELTAERAVEAIRPGVYVRGDDYALEDLPEAYAAGEVGAEIVLLPRETGVSTSGILKRVAARSPFWSPGE